MNKILSVCAIAAAFAAAPAFGQGYVGLGVGSSSASGFDRSNGVAAFTGGNVSKTSTKILGGYQITPTWGVEAQYTAMGKRAITVTPVQTGANTNGASASQFGVSGTATLPINAGFSLIGKLGISANSVKVTDTLGGSATQNNTNLSFGLGASYKFTPNIALRAEYEDFGKFIRADAFGGPVKGNNLSLSLLYSF